jgi:nucleotide-binding universal stress UspA family protein
MFQTILVPLDGSKLAEESLAQVRELARTHRSKVILLRVAFALVFPGADPTKAQIQVTEEAEEYLEKIQKKLEAKGIRAETVVRYGFPAEEILAHINRGGVDLLAMTTHGRTGPVRMVMGSVAEQVIRHSAIPALLVRASGSRANEIEHAAPAA